MGKRRLSLDTPKCRVHTFGIGGATTQGSRSLFPAIRRHLRTNKYHLIILDLGSNDLDPTRHDVSTGSIQRLTAEYHKAATELAMVTRAKVVLCLPIPRDESQFPGSYEATSYFNELLKEYCNREIGTKRTVTWTHKGLFKKDSRYLDKHGVHLNVKGTIKYFHSVQAAVKFHAARL